MGRRAGGSGVAAAGGLAQPADGAEGVGEAALVAEVVAVSVVSGAGCQAAGAQAAVGKPIT